ncbi:MAG: DUF2085 domain-containing protein [Chloroflexi bacterium]|nr:DUF2085 domain-containing protein [Chloroflexota bacterium]
MKAGNLKNQKTSQFLRILLVFLCLGLILTWLINTPPGLLGKSDAVAYAVCHRIPSHSFGFSERPFSLCARCSGQYLGFLWGFGVHLWLARKKSGFPSRWTLGLLAALFLVYAVDGFNSVFHLYPVMEKWSLYEPLNALRLFTGLGMGIVISSVLYPLLGQILWRDYSLEKALMGFRDWALLLGGALGIGFLVLAENPLITYPLILLSTGGLMILLTLLYSVIWILITKKENHFDSWQQLVWWGIAGFSSALFQIAMIDLVRYLLTGTWSGFLDY